MNPKVQQALLMYNEFIDLLAEEAEAARARLNAERALDAVLGDFSDDEMDTYFDGGGDVP